MRMIRPVRPWLGLGAVSALMVFGVAISSETMFKISRSVLSQVQYLVAVPDENPYPDADAFVQQVLQNNGYVIRLLLTDPPTYDFWTGGSGNNFLLEPGEAYMVVPAVDMNITIVGSHRPGKVIPAGGLKAGMEHWVSIPYNSTLQTADAVLELFGSGAVESVCRHVSQVPPAQECWDGLNGVNFSLKLGEGYVLNALTNAAGEEVPHW